MSSTSPAQDTPAQDDETLLVCDLSAIPHAERDAHISRTQRLLLHAAQEHLELIDGYAWRFVTEEYAEVCRYVDNERKCCPFLTFQIEAQAHQGAVWLRITGSAAAKAVLQAELGAM